MNGRSYQNQPFTPDLLEQTFLGDQDYRGVITVKGYIYFLREFRPILCSAFV